MHWFRERELLPCWDLKRTENSKGSGGLLGPVWVPRSLTALFRAQKFLLCASLSLLHQAREMGHLLSPLLDDGSPGLWAKNMKGSPAPGSLLPWQGLSMFNLNFPKIYSRRGAISWALLSESSQKSQSWRRPGPTGVWVTGIGHHSPFSGGFQGKWTCRRDMGQGRGPVKLPCPWSTGCLQTVLQNEHEGIQDAS